MSGRLEQNPFMEIQLITYRNQVVNSARASFPFSLNFNLSKKYTHIIKKSISAYKLIRKSSSPHTYNTPSLVPLPRGNPF